MGSGSGGLWGVSSDLGSVVYHLDRWGNVYSERRGGGRNFVQFAGVQAPQR